MKDKLLRLLRLDALAVLMSFMALGLSMWSHHVMQDRISKLEEVDRACESEECDLPDKLVAPVYCE